MHLGMESLRVKLSQICRVKTDEIPESILAFSTFATILSYIRRPRTFSNEEPTSRRQRVLLRVLNALATLLVRDTEDVAITAKNASKNLELIACMRARDGRTPVQYGILRQIWTWAATLLTRSADNPTLIDPNPPNQHLGDLSIDGLERCVDKGPLLWTFEAHIWMISKLLNQIISTGDFHLLQRYITGAASLKIARRLNHETLSKPFFTCLQGVDTSRIPAPIVCDTTDSDCQRDKPILSTLRLLDTRTLIPKLTEQAEAARDNKSFEVYTKETQIEFHDFLCEILQEYETSMNQMAKYHDPKESVDLKCYKYDLYKAAIYGNALLHLARSSAVEKHLQAIESLLTDFRRDKADDVRMVVEENENEIDDDLRGVQPSSIHDGDVIPLWQSYLHWLRLTVSHFDAISVLTQYIKRQEFQYNNITIKILVPPRVCKELITWKKLLESNYFPEPQLTDVSTDDIISFLQKWSDSDKEAKGEDRSIDEILKTIRASFDSSVSIQLTEQLKELEKVGSSGWKAYIKIIVEGLEQSCRSSTVQEAIPDIIQQLVILQRTSLLFKMLRKAPLSSGTNFPGAIHCAPILAILFSLSRIARTENSDDSLEEVLDELRNIETIIGVCERLCPLCAILLRVLGFTVRGSHSTISPCALPTWTPTDSVERVNRALGSQLRRELVEIMECTYLPDIHASSSLEHSLDGMNVDTD